MLDIIEFKSDRVLQEWDSPYLSQKLKNIILILATYSWYIFEKKIIITSIFRTQEEQDKYYSTNENYKKKPWKSVHQLWRGVDLRSYIYTDVEIQSLLKITNTIPYDLNRPNKKTAIYHNVGVGDHLHIQIVS